MPSWFIDPKHSIVCMMEELTVRTQTMNNDVPFAMKIPQVHVVTAVSRPQTSVSVTFSATLMYIHLINMMYLQHRKKVPLSEYRILCKLSQIMQIRNMQMS